jgi:hypothetical protein
MFSHVLLFVLSVWCLLVLGANGLQAGKVGEFKVTLLNLRTKEEERK